MLDRRTAVCAVVVLLALVTPSWAPGGFHGIPGDYCKYRVPTCCPSRDDECTVSILGNHLCYCDMFCDRPNTVDGGDCCPDFYATCRGEVTTTPWSSTRGCDWKGKKYPEGQNVKQNCRNCNCGNGGQWQCEDKACVIQEDLLKKVNEGRFSWKGQNYTDFYGMELSSGMRFRLGTLFPEKSVENMNEIVIKPRELPAEFDARTKWPGWIHPIRNQENCGSSWAFSTTSTAADRLAIMSEGKLNEEISPQQLLSCNQHRQHGCEGGYLDRAWWYIRKLGVVGEECYPYTSGRTNEPGTCAIPKSQYRRSGGLTCPSGSTDARAFKMTPPYRVSSKEEDIMTEIMVNGPVQATFLVHEDFFMYGDGVYQHSELAEQKGAKYTAEGYHSVRLLGWGVDRTNGGDVKYWLGANSWGPYWGQNGYFKIVRGENHCDIESFIIGSWGKGSKKRRRRFKVRKLRRRRLRRL